MREKEIPKVAREKWLENLEKKILNYKKVEK